MKPLIVLIVVFLLALLFTIVERDVDYFFSGRLAMAVMLLFTSIGHFKFTEGMSMMMPPFIPSRKLLVYITGFIEIAAAIALLIPSSAKPAGWFLIAFFVVLLPANIYAAIKRVNYEKGTYDGPGPLYLWFRIPLQLFLIGWVYYFVIRDPIF